MKLKQLAANQTELRFSDGSVVFVSYETPVAAFIPGSGYYRTTERYSVTTSKHITQWLRRMTGLGNYETQTMTPEALNKLIGE